MKSGKVKRTGKTGGPNAIDVHVGQRLRQRRTLLGMSQTKLGDAIGLTFQQVQKYERGANRIGASRLFDISKVLDVPVGYFFEDMPVTLAKGSPAMNMGLAEDQVRIDPNSMAKRETLELVRAYYRITDPQARKRLFDLVVAMAGGKKG